MTILGRPALTTFARIGIVPLCVGAYIAIAGATGFCPLCQVVTDGVKSALIPHAETVASVAHSDDGQEENTAAPTDSPTEPNEDEFAVVRRDGAVVLEDEYDLSNAQIPIEDVHTLLPRDAIPALTDPTLENGVSATWMRDSDEVIAVVIGDEAVAFPIRIMDFHEIANVTIGGEHIAATWCPLCRSATVISRVTPDGETLEFGVSGALYNSNVMMYDRTHKALWSQLGMQAVTGPMAGTRLEHYPVQIVSWLSFRAAHSDAKVLSIATGHDRDYAGGAYANFFQSDRLLVPVRSVGDALPKKTLGLGVLAEGQSWFIPEESIGDDGVTLSTPLGDVLATRSDAGIMVTQIPEGVMTAQTFYYSWSAFNPRTEIVR